jgi:hypothetical protein
VERPNEDRYRKESEEREDTDSRQNLVNVMKDATDRQTQTQTGP